MTDKKFFVLLVATIGIFLALFYSARSARRTQTAQTPPAGSSLPQATIPMLESRMQQLKDAVSTYGQLNVSLHKAFNEEKEKSLEVREKAMSLQEELKNVTAQKDALSKELSDTRTKLEMTQPLKQKLIQMETALSGLNFSQDMQGEVVARLDTLIKELDSIDQQMPYLLNENMAFKVQVQNLSDLLGRKEQELAVLKQQAEDAKVKNQTLSKNVDALLEQLMAASKGRQALEQKAADLEKVASNLKKAGYFLKEKLEKTRKELGEVKEREARAAQEKQEALGGLGARQEHLAALETRNQALEQELASLKEKLETLSREYAGFKDEHATAQLAIRQTEAELKKNRDEISYFKDKLADADTRFIELQSKYNEVKKESAVLREQYVNVQLERERLRDELQRARMNLSELQNKFQKIGTMFMSQPPPQMASPEEGASSRRKVDVELLPKTKEGSEQ